MSSHTERQRRELLQGVGKLLDMAADDPDALHTATHNWPTELIPTLVFTATNERQMNRKLAEHINDLEQGV